ncbi:hypothetical protein GQ53DRAFT_607436, partial [Thozetella sp. PMI_491]
MVKKPMRLPPLERLRVRNPNRTEVSPCVTVMISVLTCWASAGHNTPACAGIESALRSCMDAPAPPAKPKNTINYHLMRFSNSL